MNYDEIVNNRNSLEDDVLFLVDLLNDNGIKASYAQSTRGPSGPYRLNDYVNVVFSWGGDWEIVLSWKDNSFTPVKKYTMPLEVLYTEEGISAAVSIIKICLPILEKDAVRLGNGKADPYILEEVRSALSNVDFGISLYDLGRSGRR